MNHLPFFSLGSEHFLVAKKNGLFSAHKGDPEALTRVNYEGGTISWVWPGRTVDDLSFFIEDGVVWFLGSVSNQLGMKCANQFITEPQQFNHEGITIKAIAPGWFHTLFLSTEGEVYSSGANLNGQLGLKEKKYSEFSLWKFHKKINFIAAGPVNSFIITDSGELYGCGENMSGELGLGLENRVGEFTRIPLNKWVKKIIPSGSATYLITNDGEVYSCGKNINGRLGYVITGHQTQFKQVPLPEGVEIKELIVVDNTVLALSEKNQVFGWGYGKSGLLGSEHLQETRVRPQRINLGKTPVIAMYGSSYFGVLLVTDQNEVLNLGENANTPLVQNAQKELGALFSWHNKGIKSTSRKAHSDVSFFFAADFDAAPPSSETFKTSPKNG